MSKSVELKQKAAEAAANAREIAERGEAGGRSLSAEERAKFDAELKSAKDYLGKYEQAKADEGILAQAKALAAEVGGPIGSKASAGPVGRKAWGKSALKSVRESMGRADGSKALVSGSVSLANPVSQGVTPLGAAPTSVLDLLRGESAAGMTGDDYGRELAGYAPRFEESGRLEASLFGGDGGGGNTYTYLRQTVRDSNAAPVKDGAKKPTSVYSFEEVEGRYKVVAHISEPVPLRYFHDDKALGDFLANEMGYGLAVATEGQALTGDGLGENFTGVLETEGILSQAWAVDLLTTLRKAVTALQVSGVDPSALVLHPADAERLDLLREGEGTGKYLIGDPAADAVQALWRVPRVPSVAVPVGTAVMGDWDGAELTTRQEATLHVDTGGALFDKNQARFRVETRADVAVKRPGAFVKVDVAEPVIP